MKNEKIMFLWRLTALVLDLTLWIKSICEGMRR